ncbi:nucleoside deaminase [Methanococcoides burtonii]|uniref:Guanine deaminase n=1 Tax=Methanococcoides burtonii (strain DSM 6242 / NBRC 107633 / OCM 468 / ACE-M) TaxID=259564 RepID=Q12ZA1_METBU|nr:nucleoside deaminase [Methanococcoides burtonii]ABE51225.1 Guanine deaminase [Methanococcoides burtonii DSM 6242]
MSEHLMEYFMDAAVKEAQKGMRNNEGGPFGAVIVKDDTIISKGHNEVLGTNDPSAHAEIVAIRKASAALEDFDLSGCELYATTMPCPMCLSAIMWARIGKIYYGTSTEDVASLGFDDGDIYAMLREGVDTSVLSEVKIECENCYELFDEWSKKPDKRMY